MNVVNLFSNNKYSQKNDDFHDSWSHSYVLGDAKYWHESVDGHFGYLLFCLNCMKRGSIANH